MEDKKKEFIETIKKKTYEEKILEEIKRKEEYEAVKELLSEEIQEYKREKKYWEDSDYYDR